jgi:hypothetical protein
VLKAPAFQSSGLNVPNQVNAFTKLDNVQPAGVLRAGWAFGAMMTKPEADTIESALRDTVVTVDYESAPSLLLFVKASEM